MAAQAGKRITIEGQEKDVTTAGLAHMNMNMILHDFPTANIVSGDTLAAPKFKNGEQLRTYDYVVANPPFSDKTWATGITPSTDPFQRFAWGEPPAKPLNKDVKTFDQMALALHYHMFQLVVVANNGQYGGSNAYWPRSEDHVRQVFHTHGQPQASTECAVPAARP